MPYPQLDAIAEAYGVPARGEAAIAIVEDGARIVLSLDISSGHVTGLVLHAPKKGLPEVTLRREEEADRIAKEDGLSVEAQVGEALFDYRVYIETTIPAAAVKTLLASAEARAGILRLLESCPRVEIGPEGVTLSISGDGAFAPDALRELAVALAAVAKIPVVRYSALDEANPPSSLYIALSVMTAVFSAGSLVFALAVFTPDRAALPLWGVVFGLLAWMLTWPVARRLARGHARGLLHYRALLGTGFLTIVPFFSGFFVILNGALDRSPSREERGSIVWVRHYESDGAPMSEVKVAWPGGVEDAHTFQGHLREGDAVTVVRRKGRFEYGWIERGYEANPAGEAK